jgi:hypothetical protein
LTGLQGSNTVIVISGFQREKIIKIRGQREKREGAPSDSRVTAATRQDYTKKKKK